VPHRLIGIVVSCLLIGLSVGCRHLPTTPSQWFQPPPPTVFQGPPTIDDVVRVVNSNSAPIRQLSANTAYLTVKGFPPLRTDLHLDRPRRFRLEAKLLGPELDLGSNDEVFWIWIKQSPEPGILYARHDEFARSNIRQQMPLDPLWLTEALGIVELDPHAQYEGPQTRPGGELEIRSRVMTPQGELTRSYIVHATYGWVLQQHIHDARGQLLVSARASKHRYDPNHGVSLPQLIEMTVPPADLAFSLSVGGYQINQPVANPDVLWSLPQIAGYPLVNLMDPEGQPSVAPNSPSSAPAITGPSDYAPTASETSSTPDTTFSRPPAATPTYTPQPPPGAKLPRYRGYTLPWK